MMETSLTLLAPKIGIENGLRSRAWARGK